MRLVKAISADPGIPATKYLASLAGRGVGLLMALLPTLTEDQQVALEACSASIHEAAHR